MSSGGRGRAAQRAVQRCIILGHTRELVVDNLLRLIFPQQPGQAAAGPGGGLVENQHSTDANQRTESASLYEHSP